MGFTIVSNPAKADVIVGNRSLTDAEINLVKEGKPYVGYTANALKAAKAMGIGVEYVDGGGYDALTTVTYESDSLITAKYKKEKRLYHVRIRRQLHYQRSRGRQSSGQDHVRLSD